MISVQTQCQWDDLVNADIAALAKAIGVDGVARLFDRKIEEVKRRVVDHQKRQDEKLREPGAPHIETPKVRDVLELQQQVCGRIMSEAQRRAQSIESESDMAGLLKQLDTVRKFQDDLAVTVKTWLDTADGVEAIKAPVMALPVAERNQVLREWAKMTALRLAG